MNVNFEWDEIKRQTNIRKHGIDFVDVPTVFDGVTVTIEDTRYNYGENHPGITEKPCDRCCAYGAW